MSEAELVLVEEAKKELQNAIDWIVQTQSSYNRYEQ